MRQHQSPWNAPHRPESTSPRTRAKRTRSARATRRRKPVARKLISSTRVRTLRGAGPAGQLGAEVRRPRDVGVGPEDDLRPLQSLAILPRPITARSAGAPAAKLDPPQRGHAGLLEVSPRPVQIAAALPGPGPKVHNFQSARRGSDPGAFLQDTPRRSECNHQIVAAGADGCLDDSVDGAGFSHADRPEDQAPPPCAVIKSRRRGPFQ